MFQDLSGDIQYGRKLVSQTSFDNIKQDKCIKYCHSNTNDLGINNFVNYPLEDMNEEDAGKNGLQLGQLYRTGGIVR